MSTNNENANMAGPAQSRIKTLSLEQRNRLVKVIAKKKFYMDKSYQYFCETADSYIPKINDELEKPSKIQRLEEAAENFEYKNYINGDPRFVDANSGKIWNNRIDYITFKADLVELCHMILETD
ncbi:unnamed protein product [Orchesella dallaii]|uniref:Uncharacterized protein n=1 Tax=Orchesella dallaii TaxID=48710 RepID=A0ABP1S302_9HEXA